MEKSKRRNEYMSSHFKKDTDKKAVGKKKKTGLYKEDRPPQAFNGKSNKVTFFPLR